MGIPRNKNINLFEDVRDDGYEYGWEDFSKESVFKGKRVEIRRKAGSGVRDPWEFKWNGKWWIARKFPWHYTEDNIPNELVDLSFALLNNIPFELNVADNWRTHNARQRFR